MLELTGELDALIGRGKWEQAESLLLTALDRARSLGDERLALSVESERMGFYRMAGKEAEFLSSKDSALSLLGRVRIDRRSRGTILINAATGLVAFGRAGEALPLYEETETLYRAVLPSEDPLFAALFNNRASALWALGDDSGAERSMLRALDILRQHPHHPDTATTWVNLAQLYADFGAGGEKVRDALTRAWEVFDDPEVLWNGYYAHTALKCAGAFETLGLPEKAAELRERAELIYEGT